jgi:pimeloyl-ACP methyl ester carboxylesterase
MPSEIILPRVDMDMETGRISRWYAEEGEYVEKGALLFDLETSKAAMEIEAPASGILRGRKSSGDAEIPVGEVVGWIYAPDETYDADVDAGLSLAAAAAAPVAVLSGGSRVEPDRSHSATTGVPATPLARRLAREQGIDLADLTGSGLRGRVQGKDVVAPGKRSALALSVSRQQAGPVHRAWLREGTGTPCVLLHGFGSELDSWRPLVTGAHPLGPVLAIDLPAHGRSAPLASADFEGLVEAVAAVVAEENVTTAHLLGHSLGGAVATALAAGHRGFVARSVLAIAPAGLGPGVNGAFLEGFLRARQRESLAPWLALTVADIESLPADFLAASLRPRQRDGYLDGLRDLAAALFPDGTQAFSIRNALNALAIPKRVIFGLNDKIISPSHARGLAGSVGVHLFPGVGHLPQMEAQSEVARIWLEVVRSAG